MVVRAHRKAAQRPSRYIGLRQLIAPAGPPHPFKNLHFIDLLDIRLHQPYDHQFSPSRYRAQVP